MINIYTSSFYEGKKLQKQRLKFSETRGTEESVLWVMNNSSCNLSPNSSDFSSLQNQPCCASMPHHTSFCLVYKSATGYRLESQDFIPTGNSEFSVNSKQPWHSQCTKELSLLCIWWHWDSSMWPFIHLHLVYLVSLHSGMGKFGSGYQLSATNHKVKYSVIILYDNYWLPLPVSSSHEHNLLTHPQHTQKNGGSDKDSCQIKWDQNNIKPPYKNHHSYRNQY